MSQHYFTQEPAGDAVRRVRTVELAGREVEVVTAGGVFSPEHLDTGTRVLLDTVPEPAAGDLLDLGCGWGAIALDAALRARDSGVETTVWALDVNERALDLTAANAKAMGLRSVRTVTAGDVPAGTRFTQIWSNPPIRVGKTVLHEMLRTWLPRLAPGGGAHLVVAKKLGADSLLSWLNTAADAGDAGSSGGTGLSGGAGLGPEFSARRVANKKGFRVLRVDRAG